LRWPRTKKNQGNVFYKAQNLRRAYNRYEKALSGFQYDKKDEAKEYKNEEDKEKAKSLKVTLLSNMALIKSKQKDWQAVIDKSTEALNFDEKNVKSLFRRGEAHAHLGNDEESVQDLRKAAALDHADKNISTLLSAVEKRIRVEQEKQRKRFRGIFNKVSLADEENGGYTKEAKPPAPASESHSDSDDDEKKRCIRSRFNGNGYRNGFSTGRRGTGADGNFWRCSTCRRGHTDP